MSWGSGGFAGASGLEFREINLLWSGWILGAWILCHVYRDFQGALWLLVVPTPLLRFKGSGLRMLEFRIWVQALALKKNENRKQASAKCLCLRM